MLTSEFHSPMTRALIEAQSKDFEQMFACRYAKYGIVSELDELAQSRQNEKFHPKKYLFFSDEPDWVEQNICNYISQPYEIMRGNKAWEDLWLLAHCPIIVASQGSFGKVAAQLNPDAVLIQCDNKHAKRDRERTYFVK